MDINTVTAVRRPASAEEITQWRAGNAWLAGGTWLFSERQPDIDTLIDLQPLGWAPLEVTAQGLDIAATCSIADLHDFQGPVEWTAAPLIAACCECLLASFKIWNAATAGGNICMSLPAGAVTAMAVSLEAQLTLLARDGSSRTVAAVDFVTGDHSNILQPGELLRKIHLPAHALMKSFAIRHASLTKLGRSAALITGTQAHEGGDMLITITASTPRPVQLRLPGNTSMAMLRETLDQAIPQEGYFDDTNGTRAWKRHLTRHFAEDIRAEFAARPAGTGLAA